MDGADKKRLRSVTIVEKTTCVGPPYAAISDLLRGTSYPEIRAFCQAHPRCRVTVRYDTAVARILNEPRGMIVPACLGLHHASEALKAVLRGGEVDEVDVDRVADLMKEKRKIEDVVGEDIREWVLGNLRVNLAKDFVVEGCALKRFRRELVLRFKAKFDEGC